MLVLLLLPPLVLPPVLDPRGVPGMLVSAL